MKRRWHCKSGEQPSELDKRIMYLENKGALVPTRELVLSPEQIEGVRRAGVVNTGVLDAVGEAIHAGMSTLEIDQICRDYCEKHGAIPACLNYEGYPMSVCTSINEVVCHGIPKADDILEEGDIINVDFTTILDGYYADASRMFIIGKTTPEKEQLVKVTKECLEIGMEAAKPWHGVNEIGRAIEKHAKKYMVLVPGMVFTIEPMINMGTWKVFIDADDPYGWEVISEDEQPSAQWEHTLLMTENGVEVLSY